MHDADDAMARITAERLVQHLEMPGFVLMKNPTGPLRAPAGIATPPLRSETVPGYAELQVCSNYSFLRGACRVEELLLQADALGLEAIAITDHNTLAGISRAHARAAEVGIRLIVGCRLELRDSLPLLAYPLDRAGYGRLIPTARTPDTRTHGR